MADDDQSDFLDGSLIMDLHVPTCNRTTIALNDCLAFTDAAQSSLIRQRTILLANHTVSEPYCCHDQVVLASVDSKGQKRLSRSNVSWHNRCVSNARLSWLSAKDGGWTSQKRQVLAGISPRDTINSLLPSRKQNISSPQSKVGLHDTWHLTGFWNSPNRYASYPTTEEVARPWLPRPWLW